MKPAVEPIKDGLVAHLHRIDELTRDLGGEIAALQRIEAALKDCHDRLDRQGGLIVMETQLVEALIKKDASPPKSPANVARLPSADLADRIGEDLEKLVALPKP
jgi:hypothetical protein